MINSVKLGKGGRLVIPIGLRRQMGVEVGDKLVLRYRDNHLEIQTVRQAVLAAQQLVKRYTVGKRILVQESIAERNVDSLNDGLPKQARGLHLVQAMRGKATSRLSTDKIIALTRKA